MEPVMFPFDVRHDITFYGLKITKIWIPITGLVGSGAFFLIDIPFISVLVKLILLVMVPVALFVFFVFDMNHWIKKIRNFAKEPSQHLPDSRCKEGSLQYLIDMKARRGGGPFLDFKGGYIGVIMSVQPLPWSVMTENERTTEVAFFQSALSRALENNLIISIYTDFDLDLPRIELEKKAIEWRTRFAEESGLRILAEARLANHNKSSYRSVKPVDYIRLLWKPSNRDLPRKPRNEKEKETLVAMAFSAIIETFIANLSSCGIHCRVLGAEAARDMVSRQLNPADWRRITPVANTDWESRLASQPVVVTDNEVPSKTDADVYEERASRLNLNLVAVVTFEQGTDTKLVTIKLVESLIDKGYSVSLIDADIYNPGSLSAEYGVRGMSIDWRTALKAEDAVQTPYKGLVLWGLSNEVFSVELSRPILWKVIGQARRWSHIVVIHMGDNEGSLTFLQGKARILAVAGHVRPEINNVLKFSKAGASLIVLNESDATAASGFYRVKRCHVLEKDIGQLADSVSGMNTY